MNTSKTGRQFTAKLEQDVLLGRRIMSANIPSEAGGRGPANKEVMVRVHFVHDIHGKLRTLSEGPKLAPDVFCCSAPLFFRCGLPARVPAESTPNPAPFLWYPPRDRRAVVVSVPLRSLCASLGSYT